jgi:hypothetical protein
VLLLAAAIVVEASDLHHWRQTLKGLPSLKAFIDV